MAHIDLLTTSNLLRYISEWDPREPAHTKGGYMDGKITVPSVKGKLKMDIQTYPAEDVDPLVSHIHPCILHVVRIGKGKREQELEPVPTYYHWKQQFEIENGRVKILNRISKELDVEKDGFTPRPVPVSDYITEVQGNTITLGRKRGELNLILLQPKQQARAKASEATVTKVLADRLQTNCPEKIEEYEKFFKKKNAKNLKRIRIRVDFYTENGENCGTSISVPIIDTGNKEIGSMDFYDANPHKSCVRGGRKVIMVSEYNLDKNVSPIFQVYDEHDQHHPELDELLVQPNTDEYILKNQTIIFLTPNQPRLAGIQENLSNYKIKLLAKRKGDGYTSNKMFNFRYIEHEFNNCPFCDFKVDSDEHVQIEAGIERPKPRQKKRVMHAPSPFKNEKRQRVYSTDEESITSSAFSPGFKLSPVYSNPSPYKMQMSSPDSGIDTYFNNSDGGHTPESDYDYTNTITQADLEQLGVVTEQDQLIFAEEFTNNSKVVYAPVASQSENMNHLMDQGEFTKMLEIPPENVESLWGHQKVDTYDEVIKTIDFDELINTMDFGGSKQDYVPQTTDISSMEHCLDGFAPNFPTEDVMMSNRDPMISHGIMTTDGSLTVRKQGPVVLQQRICRDSASNKDIEKPTTEEIIVSETKDDSVEEKKRQENPKVKKPKADQESLLIEDLPLFVMIFMVLLIIFKLVAQATIDLPPYAVTAVSMASAISVIFVKNRF